MLVVMLLNQQVLLLLINKYMSSNAAIHKYIYVVIAAYHNIIYD